MIQVTIKHYDQTLYKKELSEEQGKQLIEQLENPRADKASKYGYQRCLGDVREKLDSILHGDHMDNKEPNIKEYEKSAERIAAMIKDADERELWG